ncbi:MAG: hypothetical protein E6J72_01555, partial [Deltaproteobacteria bacterium]
MGVIASGCGLRERPRPVPPNPQITDEQRILAMLSIHAYASSPEEDRVRRAVANLWSGGLGLPKFRRAIAKLLQGPRQIDFDKIDGELRHELEIHTPGVSSPLPPDLVPLAEMILLDLLVGLTPDCPYAVPTPMGGVGDDPTKVTWSYDVDVPRPMEDIARSLDPQSWSSGSKFFYDSYLVNPVCTYTPNPGTKPSPGPSYPAGEP